MRTKEEILKEIEPVVFGKVSYGVNQIEMLKIEILCDIRDLLAKGQEEDITNFKRY